MKNIDKIIKESIQGFEAPYDSAMWDKVSSQLNPMEDAFRKATENHEVPYNSGAWSAIKNQIGSSTTLFQWIAGSAAAVGLVFGAITLLPTNNNTLIKSATNTEINTNSSIAFENTTTTESAINKINTTSTGNSEPIAELNENSELILNITENTNITDITIDNISENGTIAPTGIDNTNDNPNENNQSVDNESEDFISYTDNDNGTPPVFTEVETIVNADFSLSESEVCLGEVLLFNPKIIKQSIVHVWDFGDGTTSSIAAVSHTYKKPGTFNVSLTLKDKVSNKTLAESNQEITIHSLPNVAFSWNKNSEVIPTIDFINHSEESDNWAWKINDRMISDKDQFEYTFRKKGNNNIELSTRNEFGCENKIKKQIKVEKDYNLLAANTFTPNGDKYNNTFIPAALTISENEFTMTIYNQVGTRIYTTNNAYEPWDGRDFNDNTEAPAGVYVWIVTMKNGNGINENYKGQILVIR